VALDVQQFLQQLGCLQVVQVLYTHDVEVCMDLEEQAAHIEAVEAVHIEAVEAAHIEAVEAAHIEAAEAADSAVLVEAAVEALDIEVGIDASEEVQVEEQELAEAALRSHYRQVCRNYIAIEATWELVVFCIVVFFSLEDGVGKQVSHC